MSRPGPIAAGAPAPAGRDQAFLQSGQLLVATRPTAITTILGSCVSVCLYDRERGIGGMNHFLLPLPVEREQSPRFGAVAVPRLLVELLRAGARRGALQAKVFGGASILGAFRDRRSLGQANAELALELLDRAGVAVVERSLGGQRGRKLIFHADDGAAWVREL